MSEIKVNSIKGVGASAAAITVNNSDGTCTANLTNKPNRNLIINGAMNVAQRGTSSTGNGYGSVDRFSVLSSGTNEAPTHAQADVASGTTPYTLGFRKALKITNGNQTSGAGAADRIRIMHTIEAQDIANSGWNYKSASSYITLSFWVKSSVAQNFYGFLLSLDGTSYNYPFETGSLTADTWTKVTKIIPGDSNITFNNDNGAGLTLFFYLYLGTTYANNSVSLNAWKTIANPQTPTNTTTWFTTNDSTLEMTGLQIEVGPVVTPFEHRSFGDELARCHRYFFKWSSSMAYSNFSLGYASSATVVETVYQLPVIMRANPSLTTSGTFRLVGYSGSAGQDSSNLSSITVHRSHTRSPYIRAVASGLSAGLIGEFGDSGSNNATMSFSAEL